MFNDSALLQEFKIYRKYFELHKSNGQRNLIEQVLKQQRTVNHQNFQPRIKITITKIKQKINHLSTKANIANNTDKLLDLLDEGTEIVKDDSI